MRYENAYFCAYAKLPAALSAETVYSVLTLGLKIHLETGTVEDVSITLLSDLAISMVKDYFVGKNIVQDYEQMLEEVTYRHQGNAQKSIIKALGDIRRSYLEYMEKNGSYLRSP